MANPRTRRLGRGAAVAALILASAVAVLVVGALAISEPAPNTLARAEGPIQLTSNAVWVPLRDPQSGAPVTLHTLSERLARNRILLVVRDLSAEVQPGSNFAVHIGTSPAAEPSIGEAGYVGRFSFYNEINAGSLKAAPSSRSYDVTHALQRLLASGPGGDPIGVTIRPERQ